MQKFKPYFEKFYFIEDMLDDAFRLTGKTPLSNLKSNFDISTSSREKIITNEKDVQFLYTCVGIKKTDLNANIIGNKLVIKGESENVFGKTSITKEISLLSSYDKNNIEIKLEEAILLVKIGIIEPIKTKIEIK